MGGIEASKKWRFMALGFPYQKGCFFAVSIDSGLSKLHEDDPKIGDPPVFCGIVRYFSGSTA